MRVVLINSADYAGGAETVVRMLRDGLRARGHDVSLWVGRRRKEVGDYEACEIPTTPGDVEAAHRYAEKGFYGLGLTRSSRFCTSSVLGDVDIIHLHNLHGHYLSIPDVARLAERAALVWTLHDFYAITGGCAFPFECRRWMDACGDCPQLGQYPLCTKRDRTRRLLGVKRNAFGSIPATIVAPSEHLARAVAQSRMFQASTIRTIPYGTDTETFHRGRSEARRELGLDAGGPVVLLAAQGLQDERKGVQLAAKALQTVSVPGLTVLLVGDDDPQDLVSMLSMHDVRCVGYVVDRKMMARCFAASDLFIFSSLAENFPCATLEAMACATAVLAFDIDGVREQIENGRTGFLVPVGDVAAMARAAGELLSCTPRLEEVGNAARIPIEDRLGMNRFLDNHEALYREVAADRAGRRTAPFSA